MDGLKVSIVIPYHQRLRDIRLVFSALAEQTMDSSQFEIVIGALEYSPEFTEVCAEFSDRINIVTVMSGTEWNVGHARNLALRSISGQVLLALDADMMLPPSFLDNVYEQYFQHGQNICVIGRMIGYDDVFRTDVRTVEERSFEHYRDVLAGLEAQEEEVRQDPRWSAEHAPAFARLPWAQACGAPVAVTASIITGNGIDYDEGIVGWGPEDQIWARRIALTGTPLVLGRDVYGLRLPHERDLTGRSRQELINWRHYLSKYPELDVELSIAYDQLETERIYPDVKRELAAVVPAGHRLAAVRGAVNGRSVLTLGAVVDADLAYGPELGTVFDDDARVQVLPVAGFALPYADASIDECRVLAPISSLSAGYRDVILREAERVAVKVASPVSA